jgi:hypothetical protein
MRDRLNYAVKSVIIDDNKLSKQFFPYVCMEMYQYHKNEIIVMLCNAISIFLMVDAFFFVTASEIFTTVLIIFP